MVIELIPSITLILILVVSVAILIMSVKKDRVKKEIPQQDTPHLPYPQHVRYMNGSLHPDQVSQDEQDKVVIEAYQAWKKTFVLADAEPARSFLRMGVEKHFLRYRLLASAEGQAYALLISVLMAGADPGAQASFDRLYTFCRAHPSQAHPALMSWQVSPDAFPSRALASSSQADMLIAYSLLMADRQWGSEGRINYQARALDIIQALKDQCLQIEDHLMLPGNWVGDGIKKVRSVDVAPLVFAAFYQETKDPIWKNVSSQMKNLLNKASKLEKDIILLPPNEIEHSNPEGDRAGNEPGVEQFTSETAPVLMHMSLAAMLGGDTEAFDFLEGFNQWIITACDGDASRIKASYTRQGEAISKEKDLVNSALISMAAVNPSAKQSWLNDLWNQLVNETISPEDPLANTFRLLALIFISHNWWGLKDRQA